MAYKLRGVGRAFQTEEQVLAFLHNSPGYVKRRSSYLKRYWPGLAAQVIKTTGLERQALEGRSRKLRGEKPSRNVFDVIGEGAKKGAVALARPVVEQAMQTAASSSRRTLAGRSPREPTSEYILPRDADWSPPGMV